MTNTDSFKAPDKYFAIDIENKDGITVDGCGSTFVIHGDMCSFAMFNCSNIKLKNFTVKYNSPTNYEMKVVKKSINKITYKIPLKSPFYIKDNKLTFLNKVLLQRKIIIHTQLTSNVTAMLFTEVILFSELSFRQLKQRLR